MLHGSPSFSRRLLHILQELLHNTVNLVFQALNVSHVGKVGKHFLEYPHDHWKTEVAGKCVKGLLVTPMTFSHAKNVGLAVCWQCSHRSHEHLQCQPLWTILPPSHVQMATWKMPPTILQLQCSIPPSSSKSLLSVTQTSLCQKWMKEMVFQKYSTSRQSFKQSVSGWDRNCLTSCAGQELTWEPFQLSPI